MIEVFIYGCTTCGINSLLLNRVRKQHGEVTANNSVKSTHREAHLEYLTNAGIETADFPAIIVVNKGERVIRLSEWKSL